MRECVDFAEKRALIFHQEDYSLARLVYPKKFQDLPDTKKDAINATHIAHGFGIK